MIKLYETYAHLNMLKDKMESICRAIYYIHYKNRAHINIMAICRWDGDKCVVVFSSAAGVEGWIELYSTSEDNHPEFIVLDTINNSYGDNKKYLDNFFKFVKHICLNNSNSINLIDRSIELKDVNKIVSKLTVNNYNLRFDSLKYNL